MLAMTDPADSPHSSPSASSTSQSPALPWEVIERAIDLCAGDKATLCAFALTCSQLHPRSLFVLFTNVDIQSQEQLKRFYDAVQAQPQLQPVVQLLSFPWDDFSPFPLLSILPGLRHVAFDRISSANTRDRQLGGRPLAAGLRSLTIRGASFPTQSAFLKFISAFPNIENLTCELDLYLHEDTPMMQDMSSRRLQLRTLNILRDVDEHLTKLLFLLAQLEAARPLAIGDRPRKDGPTSLTWWIPADSEKLQYAFYALQYLDQAAIRDVTLVLWYYDVGRLYGRCHRPAKLKLCTLLKDVLLRYPTHRVLLTALGGPVLNVRKTISWSDEFSRLFRPLGDKWALTEDVRYSGKPGHDSHVNALVVSSDGRWVATASGDSTIILWDARNACISQEWFAHDNRKVWNLAFSPDGQQLASAGGDGKVAIWDISGSSHQVTTVKAQGRTGRTRRTPSMFPEFAWSSDGAYIAFRDHDYTMQLWDGRTFQALDNLKQTRVEPLFSHDSRWLLVYGWDSLHVWDVASGACAALQFQPDGENGIPLRAAFNRWSTHVAVGYEDGKIRVWDLATRQGPLLWKAHNYEVKVMVFSPDDLLLLSASTGETVKIWNARTGDMVQSFEGHESRVNMARFSPCGKFVASASDDKTVRVWRTNNASCLATLSDHGDEVTHVAFTPDGTMLWSAACNGTVLGRRLQDIIPDDIIS